MSAQAVILGGETFDLQSERSVVRTSEVLAPSDGLKVLRIHTVPALASVIDVTACRDGTVEVAVCPSVSEDRARLVPHEITVSVPPDATLPQPTFIAGQVARQERPETVDGLTVAWPRSTRALDRPPYILPSVTSDDVPNGHFIDVKLSGNSYSLGASGGQLTDGDDFIRCEFSAKGVSHSEQPFSGGA